MGVVFKSIIQNKDQVFQSIIETKTKSGKGFCDHGLIRDKKIRFGRLNQRTLEKQHMKSRDKKMQR